MTENITNLDKGRSGQGEQKGWLFHPSIVEKYPLMSHLRRLNPGVFERLNYWAQMDFAFLGSPSSKDAGTVQIDVLGLTGLAKSLLRMELAAYFQKIGPTYTHDYEVAIALASLQGRIRNQSGSRTAKEFEIANKIDNKLVGLFIENIPERKFLIREKPGVTQDPITKSGVTRGDWDYDKTHKSRRTILEIVLGGNEQFRMGNIVRRGLLAKGTPDAEWAGSYDAAIQHFWAITDIIGYLARTNALGPDSEYGYLESTEQVREFLVTDPEAIVRFTRDVIKPRIADFVQGNPKSERVIFLYNDLRTDWQEVFKNYSKTDTNFRLGIHSALWNKAEFRGDNKLKSELIKLRVPELLHLETV